MIFFNSSARESQMVGTVTIEVLDCSRRLTQRLVVKQSLLCSARGDAGVRGRMYVVGRLLRDKLQHPNVGVVFYVAPSEPSFGVLCS